MTTIIILCIITAVLVIADLILVYRLRVLNNKVAGRAPRKKKKNR